MKYKRIMSIIAAGIMSLGLISCGSKAAEENVVVELMVEK